HHPRQTRRPSQGTANKAILARSIQPWRSPCERLIPMERSPPCLALAHQLSLTTPLNPSQQRLQLREIAGVEVGDGPMVYATTTPREQIIAVVRDEAGSRVTGVGTRPHEDVDDVQAPLVHDRADTAPTHIIEPPPDEREPFACEIFHLRGEINAA